jgi:hypothetical protein
MTERPDTRDETPEDPDEDAEGEMSADERARQDAYLLRLAEEGARDIERGDFVVARTGMHGLGRGHSCGEQNGRDRG